MKKLSFPTSSLTRNLALRPNFRPTQILTFRPSNILTSILAVMILSVLGSCSKQAPTLQSTLDEMLAQRYSDSESTPNATHNAPGGEVLVAIGDSVIYTYYGGLADMETKEPLTDKSRLNIASCSKQFTVIALMQCLEQYGGSMDDPITKYLPQYTKPFWKDITLADLAGHTSGIADSRDRSDREATIRANDEVSVAYFADVDSVQFPAGTAYDYLNPSFILLAQVIEKLSGESFVDYMRNHIFTPAGMEQTYYFDPENTPDHQAHAYMPVNESEEDNDQSQADNQTQNQSGNQTASQPKTKWSEYDYGEETFFATRPDGGIYSNVEDLHRWEKALATDKVLPEKYLHQAYTKRADVGNSPYCDYQRRPNTWYGQGWFIEDNADGTQRVYHTGDNGGFQAYIGKLYKDHNLTGTPLSIIILENRHDQDRRELYLAIEEAVRNSGLW